MAKGHLLKLNSYSITLKKFNEKKKIKAKVTFKDFECRNPLELVNIETPD